MTRHAMLALVLVSVGLAAGTAQAGGKKVKAHVTCLGNETAVKSGQAVKLGDTLWCSIQVDSLGDFKASALVGNLTVLPGPKSTLAQQPGGQGGPLHETADGYEYITENAYAVDKEYKKCEPFTIVATLGDFEHAGPDMTVWDQTIKVAASCPAPKKVKAALACHVTAQDGTILSWPGNGVKLKPRIESPMSCTISTTGKPEADVKYEITLGVAGRGTPAKGAFEHDEAGHGFFSATFEEDVYQACSNFSVTGEVRANGVSLWSGKLAVKQDCPD